MRFWNWILRDAHGPASPTGRLELAQAGRIVLGLALAVAAGDGPVTSREWAAIGEAFGLTQVQLARLERRRQQGFLGDFSCEREAARLAAWLAGRKRLTARLFIALCQLAIADGPLHPRERTLLAGIYRALGMGLGTPVSKPEETDPYRILGIGRRASPEDIRAHWRRLAIEFHPDRLAGTSHADIAQWTAHLAQINAAYDRIRQERGLR